MTEDVLQVGGASFLLAHTRQVGREELLDELTQTLAPPGMSLLQRVGDTVEDKIDSIGRAQHHGQPHRQRPLQNGRVSAREFRITIMQALGSFKNFLRPIL